MSLKLTRYGKAARPRGAQVLMRSAAGLPRLRAQLSSTLGHTACALALVLPSQSHQLSSR